MDKRTGMIKDLKIELNRLNKASDCTAAYITHELTGTELIIDVYFVWTRFTMNYKIYNDKLFDTFGVEKTVKSIKIDLKKQLGIVANTAAELNKKL